MGGKGYRALIGYEIFVRSFRDGNGDGIGDFKGLKDSLEYLSLLGVDLIWITPIFRSPSYHGYDVSDYMETNPSYGTIEDFREFLNEAHSMDFKVLIDLPINHTSIRHRWFKERPDFYIWADENTDINQTRDWDNVPIWHPFGKRYFKGTFGYCMPDLNYENDEVKEKVKSIAKFWKELGVDGLRIDAAKHLYDDHRKNVAFLREFIESIGDGIYVAEIWDSPKITKLYADAVGFVYNFHIFGALKKSIRERRSGSFYKALLESRDFLKCNFNFLSNHDVSRIASEVPGEKEREFAFAILMLLPGIPFIYYGDELGVPGVYDPKFPEDVVEPFPWTEDMCSDGQTSWKSIKFTKAYHGYSAEHQMKYGGFIWKVKRWIDVRKEHDWISEGELTEIYENNGVIRYTISKEGKKANVLLDFARFEVTVKFS